MSIIDEVSVGFLWGSYNLGPREGAFHRLKKPRQTSAEAFVGF